jgi:hypothetical protein
MGSTPRGLPWPDGTDRVTDGDDAIRELAEAIDPFAFKPVMGAIRRVSDTEWAPITDTAHVPVNIDYVSINTTQVRVVYTSLGATQIHAVQATVDEAFAAAGVRVGASVNPSYTALFFYIGASETPVNPAALTRAGANVWFSGWFS